MMRVRDNSKLQIFRSYTENGSAGRVMELVRRMARL